MKLILAPLLLILFSTGKIIGCINEASRGANKGGKNPHSISCFSVSVISSINILNLLVIL